MVYHKSVSKCHPKLNRSVYFPKKYINTYNDNRKLHDTNKKTINKIFASVSNINGKFLIIDGIYGQTTKALINEGHLQENIDIINYNTSVLNKIQKTYPKINSFLGEFYNFIDKYSSCKTYDNLYLDLNQTYDTNKPIYQKMFKYQMFNHNSKLFITCCKRGQKRDMDGTINDLNFMANHYNYQLKLIKTFYLSYVYTIAFNVIKIEPIQKNIINNTTLLFLTDSQIIEILRVCKYSYLIDFVKALCKVNKIETFNYEKLCERITSIKRGKEPNLGDILKLRPQDISSILKSQNIKFGKLIYNKKYI